MTSRTTEGSPDATTAPGPSRVDDRTAWDQFRDAVRELLAQQPSPNTVRATARRITHHVLAQAEAEITARDESPEAEHR
ncbi:hypothetical protein ACFY3G_14825 [Streptomyces phaeochromogenes]|uniref:hypothetical protein n=1 Tax=Streptomyces phaeochromogenes TaxID=1923 RepID=UPI0036746CCC